MSTNLHSGPRVIEPRSSSVERAIEVEDNSSKVRWACMMGFDIDLSQLSGSNFLGDFPSERIPRRTLFPIREAMALGPNEMPAIISRSETEITKEHLGVLEDEWASDKGRQSSKTFVNSPGFIAKRLEDRWGVQGLAIFENPLLFDLDRDKATFIYDAVLPPPSEWAQFGMNYVADRDVLNASYAGPFLFQIREFLRRHSGDYMVRVLHLRGTDLQKARLMQGVMLSATERAWRFENRILNDSEEQIIRYHNGKRGKEGYDRPDERFENARARDLEFLADTNRSPLSEKQIETAKRLAEASNSTIVAGMDKIADKFSAAADRMAGNAPAVADSELAIQNSRLMRLLAMVPEEVLDTLEAQLNAAGPIVPISEQEAIQQVDDFIDEANDDGQGDDDDDPAKLEITV